MASLAVKRSLDLEHSETPPCKKSKNENSTPRAFKKQWLNEFDWLQYDSGSKLMFCKLCIKTQNSNTFTSGCSMMKKDNLTKHKKTKDHRDALEASKLSAAMKKATVSATSKSEAAVISAMCNVYFAASINMASSLVPKLNAHCINQGVTQLEDLKVDNHTTYAHHSSISDFQECMAEVLREDLREKVGKSSKFSIMIDESTDISVKQNLVCYIRILESDQYGVVSPQTYFLGVDELHRANAESIFGKVVNLLTDKGIDIANLCGVSTDGAAVMVGSKSGVATRLKQYVPGVLATHCIAHRLALSCASGAYTIPYLVKYQETLNSIFKFFQRSPRNMADLSAIQAIIQAEERRFKEIFHTRWLSFEGAVDSVIVNYSSLVSLFLEQTSGKALALYKPITNFKFLYVSHFLADCLKPLAILSKTFQSKNLNFTEIHPLLASTIETLEEIRDKKSGDMLNKFLKEVPAEPQLNLDGLCTFQFGGHTIRDSESYRSEAEKVCCQFVNNMVRSLNDRFSDNHDSAILTSLSNFFNPSIKSDEICADIDTINDFLTTLGKEGSKHELKSFSKFCRSSFESGNKSVVDIFSCCNLAIKHRESFPGSAELAERLLVAPVSTADCERGFSRQNLIKTKLRNAICVKNLDNLMELSINGPVVESNSFDFKRAFKIWAEKKSRRIIG